MQSGLLLSLVLTLALARPWQAVAQPAPAGDEESVEAATILLQPYKLAPDAVPGYRVDSEQADTTEMLVLARKGSATADAETINERFAPFQQAHHVLSIHQTLFKTEDVEDEGVRLTYTVALLESPEGAAEAMRYATSPDRRAETDVVTPIDLPTLGEQSLAVQTDEMEDGALSLRTHAVAWRRGRLYFSLAPDASLPEVSVMLAEEVSAEVANLTEVPPPVTLSERTRAFRTTQHLASGLDVQILSVRWLRGPVELAAVIVGADQDLPEHLVQLAQEHDARYAAAPIQPPAAASH
jgi:hypothetical protein